MEKRYFKNEKEFLKYLLINSDKWVEDFYKSKIIEIKKEWDFKKRGTFGGRNPRIDISLLLKDGRRVGIEVKNPSQAYSELSRSISQLLSYAVLAEENGVNYDELAIITSSIDPILLKIIKKYNLPIRVFIVTREIHGEFK